MYCRQDRSRCVGDTVTAAAIPATDDAYIVTALRRLTSVMRSVAHPFSRVFLTPRQRSTQNRGAATGWVTGREGSSPRKRCTWRSSIIALSLMAVRSEMQYLRARDMNLVHLYAQITKSVSYSCRDDTAPQHVPSSAHYQQPQQKGWFGHEQHCSAQIEAVEE